MTLVPNNRINWLKHGLSYHTLNLRSLRTRVDKVPEFPPSSRPKRHCRPFINISKVQRHRVSSSSRDEFARNAYSTNSICEWCKKKTCVRACSFGRSKRGENEKKKTRRKEVDGVSERRRRRKEKKEKMRGRSWRNARKKRRCLCIYRRPFRIYNELTNSAGPGPASSVLRSTFFSLSLFCLILHG